MPPSRFPAPIDKSSRLRLDPAAIRELAAHLSFEGPIKIEVHGWTDVSNLDELFAIPDMTVKGLRMESGKNSISVDVDQHGYEYRVAKVWEPEQETAFNGVSNTIAAIALHWRPVRLLVLLVLLNVLVFPTLYIFFEGSDLRSVSLLVPLLSGIGMGLYARQVNRPRIILHPEKMGLVGLETRAGEHPFVVKIFLILLTGTFGALVTLIIRS